MVRKQQRPERAPGSCESETGQEGNCGSENGGDKPMKWGGKGKVLEDMSNGTETEESKEKGVSVIGDGSGEKVETSMEGESERGVKFDDNCEFMGEDANGVSEEKNVFGEGSSLLRKRLRGGGKKVNYNECAYDKELEEAISGKRRKQRKGGQKGNKPTAEEVQENDAMNEGNEVVNTKKKRGRKSKKDVKVKESEGLESKGAEAGDLEEDGGEGNKVRRRGPNKQEEKVEESASDGPCNLPRTSRNQKEQQPVSKDSKKKRNSNTSTNCHQCKRNDKGRVVGCKKCTTKRFCIPCITSWYPKMSENDIANCCPVCLGNCNCKSCLGMEGPQTKELEKLKSDPHFTDPEKVQHSKHLLRALLPYIRNLNEGQMKELVMEAKIRGLSTSEIQPQKAEFLDNERVYW